jgi:hypothetical protein
MHMPLPHPTMLEVADASGDTGGRDQPRKPVVVIRGQVGAHEGALVGGIFKVQVHVSSPARAEC